MRVYPVLTFGALLVLGGAPALAGRAVTDDERAKLGSELIKSAAQPRQS